MAKSKYEGPMGIFEDTNPLKFPTMAEQALKEIPGGRLCRELTKRGLDREWRSEGNRVETVWYFPDDSKIVTSGHGKAYRAEAELP